MSSVEENQLITVSTEGEWAQNGNDFMPSTRANKIKHLPGGVYKFVPILGGFILQRTAEVFEFPFKVYPEACSDIIARICKFWALNNRNVGVLLNGTRGAGKSMTAKLLGNVLIDKTQLPVLVVRGPIPLQNVLDAVQQDMLIIFDEFEKTHDAEHQQQLLSTIDGMSQSKYKRLYIFTTNRVNIDENFKDRPSRIHYTFEFRRVSDAIIEGLLSDSPPEVQKFRDEIFDWLHSRKICTIDIVKAVIDEVRTFGEPPIEFEGLLNVAKGLPPSYRVEIVDPETNALVSTFSQFFEIQRGGSQAQGLFSGNKRNIEEFLKRGNPMECYSTTWDGSVSIRLLDKCDEPGMWLAHLAVPRSKTPFAHFPFLYDHRFYLDNRPSDWEFTHTTESVKGDKKARKEVLSIFQNCVEESTVYGTGKPATFKILIEPNKTEVIRPSRFSANGDWTLI